LKITIITNNPLVREQYPKTAEFYDVGVKDILVRVRDMVHCGAKVLNHPQSGSIAPGVSPYKSLIATFGNSRGAPRTDFDNHGAVNAKLDSQGAPRTDFVSLSLIESALAALAAAPSPPAPPTSPTPPSLPAAPTPPVAPTSPASPAAQMGYDERTLKDFQVLDLDLLDSALQSMSAICDL